MKCPYCGHLGTRVLDTRPYNDGKSIKRRRECEECARRFTTFEVIEEVPMLVIKKDGTREEFNRNKILRGMVRACEKRPVPLETLERISDEVEQEVRKSAQGEIPCQMIGEMVMEKLYHIDEVSYVRFASVYRQFKDINVFIKELENLLRDNKDTRHPLEEKDKQV